MKLKMTFLCFALASIVTFAQTKTGTIDSDYIISLMPETKVASDKIKQYNAKLDSTFNIKVKNYQTKFDAYKKVEKTITKANKELTIKELQDLQTELKKYEQDANKILQLRRNDELRPIYAKLREVIAEIAKSKKYAHILTTTRNEFAYFDPKFDITKLALKKLGIKEPKQKK